MQTTIDLAGTGHLVVATLHSNNSPETLDRIINLFPEEQHAQVFMDLSQYLRAIISQRLIRSTDGQRVAAVEIMLNTPRIAELIQRGDVSKVKESFADSTEQGMQTFDQSLLKLYKDGKISMEEALANADSRSNLEAQIHFA
jgi:twitching motility protein PilU